MKKMKMKVSRNWLLLGGGVGFAVLAALFAMLYLKNIESELIAKNRPKVERETAVVVAARDLAFGSKIDRDNVAVRHIPSGLVQGDAITPDNFKQYAGRVLKKQVKAGRPILRSFLTDQVPLDFSDTIPEKHRGLTVQVDELNSFSGLLRPGDKVDLFVSLPATMNPTKNKVPTLIPVVQNVEVLATGKDAKSDYVDKLILGGMGNKVSANEDYSNITIDVTPKQAALIAMAREKGRLLSLLRNRHDTGLADFAMLNTSALFANAQAMAATSRAIDDANSVDHVSYDKDGHLVTVGGRMITDPNVFLKDGKVMTKDGIVLSGRGLTVGKDGKIYDKNGRLVDTSKLTQTADGRLITGDGQVIASNGLVTAPDGSLRTTDGRRVTKDGLIVNPDGTVMTKDGAVIPGVRMSSDGRIVDKNGKAVKVTKDGFIVKPDGTIMTQNGITLHGAKLNKDGKVVGPDGQQLVASDLRVDKNGKITTRSGETIAGLTGKQSKLHHGINTQAGTAGYQWLVEYIVGGSGGDGVTPVKEVPVDH